MGKSLQHALHLTNKDQQDENADFSLDIVNGFLKADEFAFLLANNSGASLTNLQSLQSRLTELRDFITLQVVSTDLTNKGHVRLGESALRVYKQNSPALGSSQSTRYYRDGLWAQSDINRGNDWVSGTGQFSGRINFSEFIGPEDAIEVNDSVEPLIAKLSGRVPGASNIELGEGTSSSHLSGQDIEMLKEYARRLGVLDGSYYTYSYQATGIDGSPTLSAVAINRVNGTVHQSGLLEGGVYLTSANWQSYVNAVYPTLNGSPSTMRTCRH